MDEPRSEEQGPQVTVTRDEPGSRYVATVEGQVAGAVVYRTEGDRVILVHTEVDDAYGGQGIGGQLARAALDDLRRRGQRVDPQCPFIAEWIGRHPAYADLVG